MAIVRAYSFRFDRAVTLEAAQLALDSLPVGDGILPHRIRGIFEDGHLLQVELHISDPVTIDRIDTGRLRLENALRGVLADVPRSTGLDVRDDDSLFLAELGKIQPPAGGGVVAGTLSDLIAGLKAAGPVISLAAIAVIAVVLSRRA